MLEIYLLLNYMNLFLIILMTNSKRKSKYNIKETRKRTLITSVGLITINSTSDIDKETKEYYVPSRDILHLKPYQRLTNEA
ncbi:MAG: hypothetical protein HFJ12_05380 [Bacilli bacterium]|nr:hypothetical protein [Bacilli bacterium]